MILFLLIVLILLLIPLGILLGYLFRHRKSNGPTQKLRYIIFWVIAANFTLLFTELVATFLSVIHFVISQPNIYVLILFVIPISLVCIANWWALIKIKQLL